MQKILFFISVATAVLTSCSPLRYFTKSQQSLLSDTALAGAHVGISVYDPAANKYVYNYQGDKYFVPASNTKLFTCYAAMKYLGDSLVGARYRFHKTHLQIEATGDPTFLHPDYTHQPLIDFLKENGENVFVTGATKIKRYGPGWSWDDYEADYMPERNAFPVFGNIVSISRKSLFNGLNTITSYDTLITNGKGDSVWVSPVYFVSKIQPGPWYNNSIEFSRQEKTNSIYIYPVHKKFDSKNFPFITDFDSIGGYTSANILSSIIKKEVIYLRDKYPNDSLIILHSQPTDSLLKPMMHRSDNFFAEQSLLMVSNEKLGYMNDEAIIDTLLKNDLKDLPQKPVWVDGSGLSRYNQFTPQDIITLLLKIKNEFGIDRIRNILPKGNTGTLTNFYQKLGTNIFAKTGTLSGQVALSGYLICHSGKLLLFSVMVNNHNSSGRAVRRAVEKLVTSIWERN